MAKAAPSAVLDVSALRAGYGRGKTVLHDVDLHVAQGELTRTKVIARNVAYHGVTLGALAFTGVASNKAPFGEPAVPVARISNTNRFRAPDGDDDTRAGPQNWPFCAARPRRTNHRPPTRIRR